MTARLRACRTGCTAVAVAALLCAAILPGWAWAGRFMPEQQKLPQDAAFDATFKTVTGPASVDLDTATWDARLEQLKALLPPDDPVRDARMRSVYCSSSRLDDPTIGLDYANDALARAQAIGDVPSQARALLCRGDDLSALQGTQQALPDIERAITLLAPTQESQLYGEALEARGSLRSLLGEQANAMLDFQRARAAYREAGINRDPESIQIDIAVAWRRMGDLKQAEAAFTASVQRMRASGDWEDLIVNLLQLGFVHLESGNPQRARDTFQEALALARQHDSRLNIASGLLALADAQVDLGETDSALATLVAARSANAELHDTSDDGAIALTEGRALAHADRHAEALRAYAVALPLVKRSGNQRYLAQLYQASAASHEALGEAGPALADYHEYMALDRQLQDRMRLEQSQLLQYEYEIRRKDFENRRLQEAQQAQHAQLKVLERVRRWQTLALLSVLAVVALLGVFAWRQWRRGRQLRRLSLLDPLTGVTNRLGIEAALAASVVAAPESGEPLALLMLDLDHFKNINDRHGHPAGDAVLRAVARAWQAVLRDGDPIGRVGGEEFMVVCPGLDLERAVAIASRLRDVIGALQFDSIDPALRVTTSIGVAELRRGETQDSLLARADAALYRAKERGRNRVES